MDKKEADELLKKYADQSERYLGSLKEDFEHKMDAVLEAVSDVPEIKRKVDMTFDKVGKWRKI